MRRWAALAGGLLLAGCAQAPAAPTIKIEARYPYALCEGDCIEFDLTMDSSGAGELRERSLAEEWQVTRFKLDPKRFEAFRDRLAAIRPAGTAAQAGSCAYPRQARPHVIPFTIEWHNIGSYSRLESCASDKVWSVIREGLRALRFSVMTARAVSAEEAAAPDFF